VRYDCVVVGAGPAGASAAYQLARRGFSTALLDKAKLPRYKPCGGLVIDRVAEWFDFDFTPVICRTVDRIVFRNQRAGGYIGEMELPRPVWMTHREVFDHFLVRKACARGAVLMDDFPVTAVSASDDAWTVISGESRVAGRYLIAADGAKGPLARWLGFGDRRKLMAGALEAEIPARGTPDSAAHMSFQEGLVGYAWNFPKEASHSIGVGAWHPDAAAGAGRRDATPLRAELEAYCQGFDLELSSGSVCGHPLLLWNGAQKLHTQRALLTGEAACMVDPWSAEGIRPSMIGGVRAAEAVARALDGESNALAKYSAAVEKDMAMEMAIAAAIARRFYFPPGPPAKPKSELLRLSARLICGDIGYRKFAMGVALTGWM